MKLDVRYETVSNLLQDRYNNKRLLITAFVNRLFSQPTLTFKTATSLKTLHDTIKECLLGLENIGVSTSAIWVHLLLRKLDKTTRNLDEQGLTNSQEVEYLKALLAVIGNRFHTLESMHDKVRPSS